jgi:hypothetical protein
VITLGQMETNNIIPNGCFLNIFLVCPIWLPLFSLFSWMFMNSLHPLHPSSIRCRGSNPQPLGHELSALTTRPVVPNHCSEEHWCSVSWSQVFRRKLFFFVILTSNSHINTKHFSQLVIGVPQDFFSSLKCSARLFSSLKCSAAFKRLGTTALDHGSCLF